MTPIAPRADAGVVALVAAALVLAAVCAAPVVLQDGDLYWHIAAGRWMIENQAVLRIDPFSATLAGHPWQVQGWLADVALALAYVGVGWSSTLAAAASAAALSAGLLAYFLARRLSAPVLAVVLVLALAVSAPVLSASPAILALPLFVVWCAGLAQARVEQRAPSFALLIALVAWANLDASYLAGLSLVVVMGLEAVIEARNHRLAVAQNWAVFAGLALVLSLITPYGIAGFSAAFAQVTLPQSGAVRTLLPLLLAAPAAAMMVQGRRFALRLVYLAALFVLSLYAKADQLLFAVATPMLLADSGAALLRQKGLKPRIPLKPALAFLVLAVLALTARLLIPVDRGDEPISPQTALAQVPASILHSVVLNDAAFGGYLIFHDVHPFIDDRPLYGPLFRERYARLAHGDDAVLAATLDRRHVRWTIFTPGSPAVAAMDRRADWQRLYADRWAVVHIRKGGL